MVQKHERERLYGRSKKKRSKKKKLVYYNGNVHGCRRRYRNLLIEERSGKHIIGEDK